MTDIPENIELGCGQEKPSGFYGVDIRDLEEVDKVQDLDEESWDLPSDYFELIRAIDVYEHVEKPINFMEEIYRIGKPGAKVVIRTPHRSSQKWGDPTHKRLAGFQTIEFYFTEESDFSFYSSANFEVEKNRILLPKRKMFLWNYLVEPIINLNKFTKIFYEQSFLSRIFPAENILFHLRIPEN